MSGCQIPPLESLRRGPTASSPISCTASDKPYMAISLDTHKSDIAPDHAHGGIPLHITHLAVSADIFCLHTCCTTHLQVTANIAHANFSPGTALYVAVAANITTV